jgi:hypothetical protein
MFIAIFLLRKTKYPAPSLLFNVNALVYPLREAAIGFQDPTAAVFLDAL